MNLHNELQHTREEWSGLDYDDKIDDVNYLIELQQHSVKYQMKHLFDITHGRAHIPSSYMREVLESNIRYLERAMRRIELLEILRGAIFTSY